MTDSAPTAHHHPGRGYGRTAALLATPLALSLALTACGPSPVDMVEHPMTTTPSRMAGEELQRAAEPENSCATEPAPAEFTGTGDRRVQTMEPGADGVEVPRSPERILAMGVSAVDVACALGLQDLVVGTSGLPWDADIYLPDSLVDLPEVDTTAQAAAEVASAARELTPDLIIVASGLDPAVVDALSAVAPTVVYNAGTLSWTAATELIADAYGRPRAGGDVLLDVIERARMTAGAATPSDTWVSLVSVTGTDGDGVTVQAPDTLGSLMLEAVGAGRPPSQRTRDGGRIPPLPESPALGDELDGDVIFAVVGGAPGAAEDARQVFASGRWVDLDAVGANRMFVVDRAVWEGAGPVAARAVLEDIRKSINGIAPDG